MRQAAQLRRVLLVVCAMALAGLGGCHHYYTSGHHDDPFPCIEIWVPQVGWVCCMADEKDPLVDHCYVENR